jgi:hypothetical protein
MGSVPEDFVDRYINPRTLEKTVFKLYGSYNSFTKAHKVLTSTLSLDMFVDGWLSSLVKFVVQEINRVSC